MDVLSLFDGISCGMVAAERAGLKIDNYYAYEIDQNAIKISKKNYPNIVHCGDVITEDFTKYKGIDLIIGGSPCQSLSITTGANRTNLDGKSRLFFEFARALKESCPKYFLFENVASMNEKSKHIISECLGCEPVYINSENFSAQNRPRLYWTNIPLNNEINICGDVLKDILENSVDEKYFYNCGYDFHGEDKHVVATLDVNTHEMLKRVYSKNFKCPTLTCVHGGYQQKKVYVNGRCRKLTPVEYERLQTLPDNYTAGVSDTARYTAVGNGWTVDVITYILKNITDNS